MSTMIELSNNNSNNNNNQQGGKSADFALSNISSFAHSSSDSQQQQQQILNNNNNNNLGNNGGGNNGANTAILARLKEIEHSNQTMQATIEKLQQELKSKDESIQKLHMDNKELSAEKRKDMEQIVETAIDDWLNSLTGISSDVRKQFRDGVTRLAEQADMKNNAWEVVCNASKAHKENVNIIEQLRRDCTERDKTIETLLSSHSDPSFGSDMSRIDGSKRQRSGDIITPSRAQIDKQENSMSGNGGGDAWDNFAKMLSDSGKSHYY